MLREYFLLVTQVSITPEQSSYSPQLLSPLLNSLRSCDVTASNLRSTCDYPSAGCMEYDNQEV